MTHTKGPWMVENSPRHSTFYVSQERHAAMGGREAIASVGYEDIPMVEDRANAHLIAAAPELLEALRMVSDRNGEMTLGDWMEVDRVLAKAEGRT